MADYSRGGFIGGPTTIRNDTGVDELPCRRLPGEQYFTREAIERYGRAFLEELFPNTKEDPDA